jgi:hypothetical protein
MCANHSVTTSTRTTADRLCFNVRLLADNASRRRRRLFPALVAALQTKNLILLGRVGRVGLLPFQLAQLVQVLLRWLVLLGRVVIWQRLASPVAWRSSFCLLLEFSADIRGAVMALWLTACQAFALLGVRLQHA